MRQLLLVLIFLVMLTLVISDETNAQEDHVVDIIAVYQSSDGSVGIYQQATDTRTTILSADLVPKDALVEVWLSPTATYAIIKVQQVVVFEYSGNEDVSGITVGELGIGDTVYVVDLSTHTVLLERSIIPDDFLIDVTFSPGFESLLRTDVGVNWSPDGTRAVWVEGTPYRTNEDRNGFGRLVVFNAIDQTVTELPLLEGTPFDVHWSPGNQYAIFQASSSFGTGAGYNGEGVYVLLPDNTIREISIPVANDAADDISSYGWLSNTQFVFSDFDLEYGGAGLFIYDVQAGTITELLGLQILVDSDLTVLNTRDGSIVVAITDDVWASEAELIYEAGLYRFTDLAAAPELLYSLSPSISVFGLTMIDDRTFFLRGRFTDDASAALLDLPSATLTPLLEIPSRITPTQNGFAFARAAGNNTPVTMLDLRALPLASYSLPAIPLRNLRWITPDVFVDYDNRDFEARSTVTIFIGNTGGEIRTIDFSDVVLSIAAEQ